jgi:hypothetical protein
LVLEDGLLKGALVVGEIEGAGVYSGLIRRKLKVERFVEALISRRPSYAPWLGASMHREAGQQAAGVPFAVYRPDVLP